MPAGYFALMVAGIFLFVPQYVVLSLLLVLPPLLQRPRGKPRRNAPKEADQRHEMVPRAMIDEADALFLRAARFAAMSSAAGYFAFLAGLDISLRRTLADAGDSRIVWAAAAVGIALAVVGRMVVLWRVWKPYASRHPQVWADPLELNKGRTASNAVSFLEWRAALEARDGPR